jgi:hypothetical protein
MNEEGVGHTERTLKPQSPRHDVRDRFAIRSSFHWLHLKGRALKPTRPSLLPPFSFPILFHAVLHQSILDENSVDYTACLGYWTDVDASGLP